MARESSHRPLVVYVVSMFLMFAALAFSRTPAHAGPHTATHGDSCSTAASGHGGSGVTASDALQELRNGNHRFVAGTPSHPSQDAARRASLEIGQAPHAIILSCSDSRVPPELVFDCGLGDIFVVRVAGNVLGIESIASIEYAVAHLGCPLIVVMGHESCGAVQTALTVTPDAAGSFDLSRLVVSIGRHVANVKEAALADPTLTPAVKANVDGVAADLVKRSSIVREQTKHGLLIVPAIYHLKSGEVEVWETAATTAAAHPTVH